MAKEAVLSVQPRGSRTPKGELKTQRAAGMIPAVVYGGKAESKSLWVSRRELEVAIHKAHSANVLFSLAGGAKTPETVLLKKIQKDILYSHPVHADFFRIDTTHQVDVAIAVRLEGESKGVKFQNGILEHLLREVKVRCLPTAIPEALVINVTDLEIGHGVLVKDLKVPEGVEMLTDENHVVVNIIVPSREEEAPAAPVAAAGSEPEIITKGKKETAEGVAPAGAAPAKSAAPTKAAPAAPGAKS